MEVTDPDETFAVYRGDPVYNQDPSKTIRLDIRRYDNRRGKRASVSALPAIDHFRKA
jgi:hypothetical protein